MRFGKADSRMLTVKQTVGTDEIRKATEILQKYKAGKAQLEQRIIEEEEWYRLRHWNALRNGKNEVAPTSAWLFNAVMNKHADLMDNVPEPNVLPRERGDEQDAKILGQVLPCLDEKNDFEGQYSAAGYDKIKTGTAVWFDGWDPSLENGLGDLTSSVVDLLNIFWKPGVTDVEESPNLFIVGLVDNELLHASYPDAKLGSAIDVSKYNYDDTVDTTDQSLVVDWYYKTPSPSGRVLLHYCKFVGDTVLFASQNDPRYAETGWYAHGQYPVSFDVLFPEKGTPAGFGLISICKDPQLYIDRLGGCILDNALQATDPRYIMSRSTGVNEEEFADRNKRIVWVEGQSLDDAKLRPIPTMPLNGNYISVLQMKIDEMKETSSNRDVTSGGSTAGVTAASAIVALQEAGNKTSRDCIAGSYRCYARRKYQQIELIRQFYDEARTFRITGDEGYAFVSYSNAGLREQPIAGFEGLYRRPVFDVRVRAQKKSPYARAAQNELAKELYALGFFAPQKAGEALGALALMEFEGRERVEELVRAGRAGAAL